MGKTLLKGIAGLFVAFCVGMTVVALWRAVMQTSGDAVTSLTINRDPAEIYLVVTDPAAFPDWSGWQRRDMAAMRGPPSAGPERSWATAASPGARATWNSAACCSPCRPPW